MSYFIGSFVPSEVSQHLLNQRPVLKDVRWVKPERYHITYKHYETIPDSEISRVTAIVSELAQQFPVQCRAHHVSGFPSSARARVIVVPVELMNFELPAMLAGKKSFKPHITLGYARRGFVAVPQNSMSITFTLIQPILVRSLDGVYTIQTT